GEEEADEVEKRAEEEEVGADAVQQRQRSGERACFVPRRDRTSRCHAAPSRRFVWTMHSGPLVSLEAAGLELERCRHQTSGSNIRTAAHRTPSVPSARLILGGDLARRAASE